MRALGSLLLGGLIGGSGSTDLSLSLAAFALWLHPCQGGAGFGFVKLGADFAFVSWGMVVSSVGVGFGLVGARSSRCSWCVSYQSFRCCNFYGGNWGEVALAV